MAARRLIAILLVLLFLSSLAAALAPVQQTRTDSSSSDSATTAEAPTLPDEDLAAEPQLVSEKVDASAKSPGAIRARVGDRLELKVTSERSGTVELTGLGPAEDVGLNQPAFFDVLLREEGDYPVRFLGSESEIALIKVSPPRAEPLAR